MPAPHRSTRPRQGRLLFVGYDRPTGTAAVAFRYDADLIDAIKAYVNPRSRQWDRIAQVWVIDLLSLPDFLTHAERLGWRVVATERGAA